MSIAISTNKDDIALKALELQQTQYGTKLLDDNQKSNNYLLENNMQNTLQVFPEPSNDIMAKLFGGDNYHQLYNHNKSEICNLLMNFPNKVDRIGEIVKNLPTIKLNIRCRWIAIFIVIILILIIIIYLKNKSLTNSVFITFLISFGSILLIGGLLYKFVGGPVAKKNGEVEWDEFLLQYNSYQNLSPFEKCRKFQDQDNINENNRILSNQVIQQRSGFGQGFGAGVGYGVFNMIGKMFS